MRQHCTGCCTAHTALVRITSRGKGDKTYMTRRQHRKASWPPWLVLTPENERQAHRPRELVSDLSGPGDAASSLPQPRAGRSASARAPQQPAGRPTP